MALDTAYQELFPGDRVIYTANHYLYFGIIHKINAQTATIIKFDQDFKEKKSYGNGNPIEFNKIYKLKL